MMDGVCPESWAPFRPQPSRKWFVCFWFLPSPVYSVSDMSGLRSITIQVELLFCYLLLLPVDVISYGNRTNIPSSLRSWPPSSDPLSCQTLLPKSLHGFTHMAPLPKFLVALPLVIALEKAGCLADVWTLQLQLYRQGGVQATQKLIQHLQELRKAEAQGGQFQWMPWSLLYSCWPGSNQAPNGPNAPSLSMTVSRSEVCTIYSSGFQEWKPTTISAQLCIMLLRTVQSRPRNEAKMGS